MNIKLAEEILKHSMPEWSNVELDEATKDIQIISDLKYDTYQQYKQGMRYIESLGLWLRQFDEKFERKFVYEWIKNNLIFISEEEMRQLVSCSYPMYIKHYLLEFLKDYSGENNIIEHSQRQELFRFFCRDSLFLGLSDGSRMDYFRRQNPQLSHEQIYVHYDFSVSRSDDMIKKLKEDACIQDVTNKYDNLIIDNSSPFKTFFLLDDFTGSGTSYIRKEKGEWKGKICSFFNSLKKLKYDFCKINVHLILYLATDSALSYIKDRINEYRSENTINAVTVDAVQIVEPPDWNCESGIKMKEILKKNYEKYSSISKSSYVDKHFKMGKGNEYYMGFSECGLCLVLCHNTPNNSLPVLWYSWDDNTVALFPRVTRHKEQ